MSAAGNYNQRFIWYTRTATREATYGSRSESHTRERGELWGYVEELSATMQLVYEMRQSTIECRIHVRNYPEIGSRDLLKDKRTGLWYEIAGPVLSGDNELIIPARAYVNSQRAP